MRWREKVGEIHYCVCLNEDSLFLQWGHERLLLLIFIHGWFLLLIFTFESYLQEMNSWEKEPKQISWGNSEFLGSTTMVWGTYKYFQLRVEKITIFFQPLFRTLYYYCITEKGHFGVLRKICLARILIFSSETKLADRKRPPLRMIYGAMDNGQGDLGQQQNKTQSSNYRGHTAL